MQRSCADVNNQPSSLYLSISSLTVASSIGIGIKNFPLAGEVTVSSGKDMEMK